MNFSNNSANVPPYSSFFAPQINQNIVPYNQDNQQQAIVPAGYTPKHPIQKSNLDYLWMLFTTGNKDTKLQAFKSLMSEQTSNQATLDQMRACLEKVESARQKIKEAEENLQKVQEEKNQAKIACILKSNESCAELLKVIQAINTLAHSQHTAMPFDQILRKEQQGAEYLPFLDKINSLESDLPKFLETANDNQIQWALDATYKVVNLIFAKKLELISKNLLEIAKQNQQSREVIEQFKGAERLRSSCHQALQQNLSILYADLGKIFNTTPIQSPDDRPLYSRFWSNRTETTEVLVITKKSALETYEKSEKEAQDALKEFSEKETEEMRAYNRLCMEKKEAENAACEQFIYYQSLGLPIPDNNAGSLLLS